MVSTAIAAALGGEARGNSVHCPGPHHSSADRSLLVTFTPSAPGGFIVHSFAGDDAMLCRDYVRGKLGLPAFAANAANPFIPPAKSIKQQVKKEWSVEAAGIWESTTSLYSSIAETYLRMRGCILPDCDDLRFLESYKGWPVMLARVTCPMTNAPLTLHFTFLQHDGSGKAPIEKPKQLLYGHRSKGGIIRLTRDEDVTTGLSIAEGIETALCCNWNPIWATGNADNMAEFPVLGGIEALAIFADNDKSGTGLKSAKECAARWRGQGREVKITMPAHAGEDWASV